ncbi:MAG: motB [Frankiales bacterium]|nr:motB [Frankiales bacterium]
MSATAARGRKRGGHEEEHENSERWMVTYADMLTLLLVLFIVLYAISSVNTSKFQELKTGLASAFKNGQPSVLIGGSSVVGHDSITPPQANSANAAAAAAAAAAKAAAAKEVEQFKKIEESIQSSLNTIGLGNAARYSIDQRGLVVTVVTDDLVFAGNSATLEAQGQKVINAVAAPLKGLTNNIQVDGHTNQENVSTAPYPTGWELSSARASAVVEYLIAHQGLPASRLSAVGFSDQHPLIAPSDPRSTILNRRVDIVVLSKLPAGISTALPAGGTGG